MKDDFIELTIKSNGGKMAIRKNDITSFYEGVDGTYIMVNGDTTRVVESYNTIKSLL